jgi:hypothetical protein
MGSTKYVEKVRISTKTASSANTVAAGTNLYTNTGLVKAGEIYFVNEAAGSSNGVVLDSGSIGAATRYSVHQAIADGQLEVVQDVIEKNTIIKATKEAYSAETLKSLAVGFAGGSTTGDLPVYKTSAGLGTFGINAWEVTDTTYNDLWKPQPLSFPTAGFASTTPTNQEKLDYFWNFIKYWNGTQSTINSQLFKIGSNSINNFVDLNLIYSTAPALIAGAVTATYGQYNVTIVAHGISAVGTYIRIGNNANNTDYIYKVAAVVDVNTLTLETAYKGTNIAAVASKSAIVTVGGSPLFGFVFNAKDITYKKASGQQMYNFDALYSRTDDNLSDTLLDVAATKTILSYAKYSSGDGFSVRDVEYKQWAMENWGYLKGSMAHYLDDFPYKSTPSLNYTMYSIAYIKQATERSQFVIADHRVDYIYVPTTATGLISYLDGVIATFNNYTSI